MYIPSINFNWIKWSSIICSFCPRFFNSQYLHAFRRWYRYFMVGSTISCFIDINFSLSAAANIFLGLKFLLMIWLNFSSQVFQVCGISHRGNFHYHLASIRSQKVIRNLIFSSLFLVVFQLCSSCACSKIRRNESTKSRSSRDNWYPISDAIIVMYNFSTCKLLIKRPSYSQWKTYIESRLHSSKLGRLICLYRYRLCKNVPDFRRFFMVWYGLVLVKWSDRDLKRVKSENDFNCRKITGKDFRRLKSVYWF